MISNFSGKYSFLSNFFLVPISYEGIMYPSVEHAFQAAKTLDTSKRLIISQIVKPGAAKRAGKKLNLRPDWEEVKLSIMLELLRKKFSSGDLSKRLKETYSEKLIEGNYWGDKFWGVFQGSGENHLGKLLMQVRSELYGIYHNLACPLCDYSPIYKEDPKNQAPTKFYCHNCQKGFDEPKTMR